MCGPKLLSFSVWIEIDLVFVLQAENDFFVVWGSICLFFLLAKIDMVSACGPEITWFYLV